MAKKVYCAWLGKNTFGDAPSVAVLEDGTEVASWVSSSESFARIDLPFAIEKALPDVEVEIIWVEPSALPSASQEAGLRT